LPARRADLRGLRILVVEDEFLVSLDLDAMLRELGGESGPPPLPALRRWTSRCSTST
jgi:hypothetical protein